MLIRSLRRILERRGYALLPWAQFADLNASRQALAEELEQLRRSKSVVSDELTSLKNKLKTQADEIAELRSAAALHDLLHAEVPGTGATESVTRSSAQARLLTQLQKSGVSLAADEPVFLHVGFGHAGGKALQSNFFARRPDLHYLGTPFGEAGSLFSNLKYLDDHLLNERQMLEWCRDFAYWNPRRQKRPIVVSDESFCDASEVYYCPRHLPGDAIAGRLKRYFPTAKIIFTICNQLDYIASMYFNLKRNYAFLAGAPLPPFDEWWAGMHTQVRCLYLQNLDYSELIDVYSQRFGRENLLVLPLEELQTHGARRYLEKLCQFMNLELHEADLGDFNIVGNERMTVVESRLAEIVAAGSTEWTAAVRAALDKESLASLVSSAPRLSLKFDDEQIRELKRVVIRGNQRLAAEFALPLESLGYYV
jgi:AcrR family transcriptional regulator